jgi:predicted ATPase/class 3 adenylate cyclase
VSLETPGQEVAAGPRTLPTGTVTFLFTDIEGSTQLLQGLGERYGPLLAESRRLLREAWATHRGLEFGAEGDAQFAVFTSALDAVRAAVMAQRALLGHDWPDGSQVRVRMGIHTGEAVLAGDDYVGLDLHRAARICNAGHGCQVLLSETARSLVTSTLPDELELRDLGEHRLKDLSRPEHLFQLVAPGLPDQFQALRTLDTSPNNLPTQLTSFVGRTEELARLRELMLRTRLLTLTGAGGTGKTRLALALAADLIDRFPDGVFWVPLAPISEPELVAPTIAQSLALHEASPRPVLDRLADFLGDKQVLIVLDNFEQLVAAAPVVGELLRATLGTRFLASSRTPLHLSGEQEYPVPPLSLPDPGALSTAESVGQFEAVRLFIERAMAVSPDFEVIDQTAPAIAAICARLDGLPLAIELAAARVKLLPPSAILARLSSRLDLLGGSARDLTERQRTLRGAIDWSHELLDEPHRRLFARHGVFVGGATLEAAEAVCGPAAELGVDVFEGLADLVDQSLLRRPDDGAEPRFSMLETIREYALERLASSGEAPSIRSRHAAFYRDLAESLAAYVLGADQKRTLERYAAEHDNLRAALTWAEEAGDAATGLRLAAASWRFWQMRGHLHEARDRLRRMLAQPGEGVELRLRARALEALGGIEYWLTDFPAASEAYREALTIYESLGDRPGIAEQHYNLTMTRAWGGEGLREAREHAERSLAIFKELANPNGVMRATWALADVELFELDYAAARAHGDEAVVMARDLDDRFMYAWALFMRGATAFQQGQYSVTQADLAEALGIFLDAGDVTGHALVIDAYSWLAWTGGDKRLALRLAGFSDALEARTGSRLAALNRDVLGAFDPLEHLGDDELRAEWEAGQRMSLEEAVACAATVRVPPALDPTNRPQPKEASPG